jgi:hypothetical protein
MNGNKRPRLDHDGTGSDHGSTGITNGAPKAQLTRACTYTTYLHITIDTETDEIRYRRRMQEAQDQVLRPAGTDGVQQMLEGWHPMRAP